MAFEFRAKFDSSQPGTLLSCEDTPGCDADQEPAMKFARSSDCWIRDGSWTYIMCPAG